MPDSDTEAPLTIAEADMRQLARGTSVVVTDQDPLKARIIAVIGVVAVVAYQPKNAGEDVYRAVPLRCCHLLGDDPPRRPGL